MDVSGGYGQSYDINLFHLLLIIFTIDSLLRTLHSRTKEIGRIQNEQLRIHQENTVSYQTITYSVSMETVL